MKTTFKGMQIEAGCEMIDVTSNHRPDTSWRHVDERGHVHQWHANGEPARGYSPMDKHDVPTLQYLVDEIWTDQFGERRELGHNECKQCGEHIEPRHTADTHKQMIPGLRWFKINGRDATEEEVRELQKQFESEQRSRL
jgi:hypothetical protein